MTMVCSSTEAVKSQRTSRRWKGTGSPRKQSGSMRPEGGHKSETDYKYAGSNTIDEVSWFWDNSNPDGTGQKTQPVGLKKPNELAIHDMSGNVWEWCHDLYDWIYYQRGEKTNPIGPLEGTNRVLRGGSWADRPRDSRVAIRGYNSSDFSYNAMGFPISRTVF